MFSISCLCLHLFGKDQPEQLVLQGLREISLGELSDATTHVQNLPGRLLE